MQRRKLASWGIDNDDYKEFKIDRLLSFNRMPAIDAEVQMNSDDLACSAQQYQQDMMKLWKCGWLIVGMFYIAHPHFNVNV
ncbi:unnamed protein product [Urochloa humidicola]